MVSLDGVRLREYLNSVMNFSEVNFLTSLGNFSFPRNTGLNAVSKQETLKFQFTVAGRLNIYVCCVRIAAFL